MFKSRFLITKWCTRETSFRLNSNSRKFQKIFEKRRIWIKDNFDRVKNLTRGHPDTCTDGCNRMETLMDTWPQLAHPPKINEISQKFKTSKISRKSRRFSSRLKKWNPTILNRPTVRGSGLEPYLCTSQVRYTLIKSHSWWKATVWSKSWTDLSTDPWLKPEHM